MDKSTCNHSAVSGTEAPETQKKGIYHAISALVLRVLTVFFPKCSLCWTSYMCMLVSFGIAKISYTGWLFPLLLLLLILNLWALLKKIKLKGYAPFMLSLTGSLIILISRTFSPLTQWTVIVGMLLIFCGSLWNSFAVSRMQMQSLAN